MIDATATPCRRGCCWTPYGVCGADYQCAHHLRDREQRVRVATAPGRTPTALVFGSPWPTAGKHQDGGVGR